MKIISYRPDDDQFWIASSKEEAEKWFVPLLDDKKLKQYHDILLENEDRKRHPEFAAEYEEIVKEAMHVDEVAYAYFNVSRDLTVCYSDVAHHPFHQLWNGYSPFCLCDHIEINSPDQLKKIVMTYEGEPFEREKSNNQVSTVIHDRILGCMVGGAVGDALGYAVEFKQWPQIVSQYGERGISRYELDNRGLAPISDDTQMALFTANAMLAGMTRSYTHGVAGSPDYYCRFAYNDWLHTQMYPFGTELKTRHSWLLDVPELYCRRAPGNTCISALMDMEHNREVNNSSCGCGGVMRTAPVALFSYRHLLPRFDTLYADEMAARAARLTHKHPWGFLPSAVLNHILMEIQRQNASSGQQLEKIINEALEALPSTISEDDGDKTYGELWSGRVQMLSALIRFAIRCAHNNMPDQLAIEKIGGGWTGHEALAIAIYSAIKHADSFEDAIISSVNHSGDSDSTGAICGNIMGCLLGRKAIPSYFTDRLELLDVIEEISEDLYNGCNIDELDSGSTPEKRRWYCKYVEHKRQLTEEQHFPVYPDDEISPAHVRKWYRESLNRIDTSSRLRRLISDIEPWDILYILAHVIDAPFSQRDTSWEGIDLATVNDAELLQKTVLFHVANRICEWPGWEEEEVKDFKLDDQQYAALRKGFAPGWDDRYATYYHRGWFYVYRSGQVLKKFKYQKNSDGMWEMTHLYTTAKTKSYNMDYQFDLMREVFGSRLWEVPLLPFDR